MNRQHPGGALPRVFGSILIAAGAVALAACGGGSSSGSGSLSLGVTDGPVDEADHVWVQFSSVTLKPAAGEPFTIELEPAERVDLLAQQNGNSELLLENEEVPAGDYDWIRLGVDLGPGETEIVFPGPVAHELDIPSGARTGLKLVSGFNVSTAGTAELTIDFDLRKSVIEAPPGTDDYKLKPALRLVSNDEAGEIAVTASGTYVADNQCGSDTSQQAVYVFAGSEVVPDDVNTLDDTDVDPVTTVQITDEDSDGTYTGTAGFLAAGDYTVAYVCDPEDDAAEVDDVLTFLDVRDVEVEAGETATYELP